MYINNSELCDLEALIGVLDGALERNATDFIEGYHNIRDLIEKARYTSEKVRDREVKTLANKIVRKRMSNEG